MKNEEWMITQLDGGGGKKKMLAPKNIIKGKQLDTSFEKHKKVATIDVKKRCWGQLMVFRSWQNKEIVE